NLLTGRNVSLGCILAQLQCADVGHYGPTVARRNLRRVIRHSAEAVGHDVEEISQRRFSQPIDVIRRGTSITALHNHSITVADPPVAGRTVDVEAVLAASHDFRRNRKGHVVARVVADFSRVEVRVFMQLLARDCTSDRIARRTQIGVESIFSQWFELRLIVHVLPAAAQNKHGQQYARAKGRFQLGTSDIERGEKPSRKRRVSTALYLGSDEKMIRKKRSLLAKANRGTLKTG